MGCPAKFAAYLHTIDSSTQIPPTGVFPAQRHRPDPYLWTAEQIEALTDRGGTGSETIMARSKLRTAASLAELRAVRDSLEVSP